MSRPSARIDLAVWILFCRSLITVANSFKSGVDDLQSIVSDFSRSMGTNLVDIVKDLDPDTSKVGQQWYAYLKVVEQLCETGTSKLDDRRLRQATHDVFLRMIDHYGLKRMDSIALQPDKVISLAIGPDLRRAENKAVRFCGIVQATTPRTPAVVTKEMDLFPPLGRQGFSGLGAYLGWGPVSTGTEATAEEQPLTIFWAGPYSMREKAIFRQRKDESSFRRDLTDFLRFRMTLYHEMVHLYAGAWGAGSAFNNQHRLHGWITFLQVLDAREVGRLSNSNTPVAKLQQATMDSLLNKDDDQGTFPQYFGAVSTPSVQGWDLADTLHKRLNDSSVDVCLSCPFYQRPGILSPYDLLHILTAQNFLPVSTPDSQCCGLRRINSETTLRGCEPLRRFWQDRRSLFIDKKDDLEALFQLPRRNA